MIDALIRWSLQNKLIVLTLAACLLAWGGWQAVHLPVDVLPDLTAPTVTILVGGRHTVQLRDKSGALTDAKQTWIDSAGRVELAFE